jgi:anti-anti-sigma regulatory factor
MEKSLDIDVEQPGVGRAVVVFKGEHDLTQVNALGKLLFALVAANELVVADFSKARFVDASLIYLLLQVRDSAEATDHRFRIQMGTKCMVFRVFEVAGVLSLLDCAPSREDALGKK